MWSNEAALLAEIATVRKKAATDTSYNNTATKNLEKLTLALEFLRLGGEGLKVYHDYVLIDGKYPATFSGKKWRVVGRNTWYPYSNPLTLLHKLRGTADVE